MNIERLKNETDEQYTARVEEALKDEQARNGGDPSNKRDNTATGLLTVSGHFEVVRNEMGAKEVHFVFEHEGKPVSARVADGSKFTQIEIVRQALLKNAKVDADCYVGVPNAERPNYQCFRITDSSRAFDFGLSDAQAAEQERSTIDSATSVESVKSSRSDLRSIKAVKRAMLQS